MFVNKRIDKLTMCKPKLKIKYRDRIINKKLTVNIHFFFLEIINNLKLIKINMFKISSQFVTPILLKFFSDIIYKINVI